MFVSISTKAGEAQVSLQEPDDCTRLHVTADGLDESAAVEILRRKGIGTAGESGHVWLDVVALRALARSAGAGGTDWERRFDEMLAYARSAGWTDPSGARVAAHLEKSTS